MPPVKRCRFPAFSPLGPIPANERPLGVVSPFFAGVAPVANGCRHGFPGRKGQIHRENLPPYGVASYKGGSSLRVFLPFLAHCHNWWARDNALWFYPHAPCIRYTRAVYDGDSCAMSSLWRRVSPPRIHGGQAGKVSRMPQGAPVAHGQGSRSQTAAEAAAKTEARRARCTAERRAEEGRAKGTERGVAHRDGSPGSFQDHGTTHRAASLSASENRNEAARRS